MDYSATHGNVRGAGKLFVCPNEMVPLQIDLAIGNRYLIAGPVDHPRADVIDAGEGEP
jgi:hypothetical protein